MARCESTLDPLAVSAGGHRGLFQLAPLHAYRWPTFWEDWMLAERNAAYAYELWAESGWRPWSCKP